MSVESHFLQTKYIYVIINSFAQEKGITDSPPENIQEQVCNPFFKKPDKHEQKGKREANKQVGNKPQSRNQQQSIEKSNPNNYIKRISHLSPNDYTLSSNVGTRAYRIIRQTDTTSGGA